MAEDLAEHAYLADTGLATVLSGMGEGGSIAPGPALASALVDALSPLGHAVVDELPLTRGRVRRFIEGARADGDAHA